MNQKLKEVFRGKVVNKAHTINAGVDEFPRSVLEYLIDNYCSEWDGRDVVSEGVKKRSQPSASECLRVRLPLDQTRSGTKGGREGEGVEGYIFKRHFCSLPESRKT